MAKKIVIPRIDAPIIDKNGNMSLAWYLYLSNLASKGGGGEPGSAATITITQDNNVRGTFLLNQELDETIDLEGPKVDSVNGKQDVVVLDAEDVGALPDSTLFANDLVASIDTSTYIMTLTMKDQNGDTIGTPQTVDLPLETMVVNGEYNATTKKIILTLVNGNTIEFSVADLVAGLQSEITSSNKLHADLVDDSSATHKFVTASDKTTWNAKQDAISDLATIRSGAALGATAVQPNSVTAGTYTKVTVASNGLISAVSNLQASDIPDLSSTYYLASNPSGYQANVIETVKVNGTALTPSSKAVNISVPTKVSDLTNDSGFISGITSSMVTSALGYTPYNSSNPSGYQANVIESVKVNGTALTITSKAVDVPVPTKVSDLTNDSGYITGISSTMVVSALGYTPVNPSSLATVATTGSYNDLSNKPTIPAAQIQADWTQTDNTKKDYIKNKPTLSTVATTGSYNDLSNKPTIPTVNNATLTIKRNSTSVGTFTANASTDKAIDITVPTKVSDLTNDSGFISGITSTMVTNALGFTPYDSANPSGYQANVIETVKVNGTALTPTSKAVNVTVPTKVSDLTNDSGFITGISASMVTTALGYTPYSAANPNGYQANVIETVKVNGVALTPSSKAVNVTVPTNVTDLADHANYVLSSSLSTVATTGSYNDLSNKPTIPTVNNPTITFMQGSTLVGTMTLNQSGNQTFTFAAGGSGAFSPDNTTITTVSGEAKVIAVKNHNTASGALAQIKLWEGTLAQYNAQRQAETLDDDTLCIVKGVSDSFDWGSVVVAAGNEQDYGSITSQATVGQDWGSITATPDTTERMTLCMGGYTLGTYGEIT